MVLTIVWLMTALAILLFCLSMANHRRAFTLPHLSRRGEKKYRLTGAALLAVSLITACNNLEIAEGIVVWLGIVTIVSTGVALTRTYFHSRQRARQHLANSGWYKR